MKWGEDIGMWHSVRQLSGFLEHKHCDTDSPSDAQDGYRVTNGQVTYAAWICWKKGWFTSSGMEQEGVRFHYATQSSRQFKMYECLFLKFFTWHFWSAGNWNQGKQNHGLGGLLYTWIGQSVTCFSNSPTYTGNIKKIYFRYILGLDNTKDGDKSRLWSEVELDLNTHSTIYSSVIWKKRLFSKPISSLVKKKRRKKKRQLSCFPQGRPWCGFN